MADERPKRPAEGSDFIRALVARDLASDKYGGRVVTRFPPEPNGYLHIGHAKSICLNFGLAAEHEGGCCHLRFDDTNPETEDPEYVASIENDIHWLGFDWGEHRYFASDYFERLYEYAEELIQAGKAYVDSSSEAEIRAARGTVTEPGTESPYRDRSVEENLDLLRRMRAGEFADGEHVLRAKIDMSAANMKMRDPLLYRIRHAHHYRQGDDWCIYPMYDFAHCLSDSIESITHSLCTLEFENNREIYDWILDNVEVERPAPEQTEFARLMLNYTVLSKRKLLELVEEGLVSGWDDPRMPTLSGLRRRGYTPEAIRSFCDAIGVAKANSVVDVGQLEYAVRDDLNYRAPRRLAVLDPLRVVLVNYPETTEELEAPDFPPDVGLPGTRKLPFGRELYIERADFHEDPPKKFFRLAPGREVRLRYAYIVRCDEVVKNEAGELVELRCTYDPDTRGGTAPDGRKIRGTIHWVSVAHAVEAEVRLYERLFADERPNRGKGGPDFKSFLNPSSLEVVRRARLEPSLATAEPGDSFQFERLGYFAVDPDSIAGRPLFNRTVTLKDSWSKTARQRMEETPSADARPQADSARPAPAVESAPSTEVVRRLDADQRQRADRFLEIGLAEDDAELLALDADLSGFFENATKSHSNPRGIANWLLNEVAREVKGRALADLPLGPQALADMVSLVDDGAISTTAGKQVLAVLLERGGEPEEIVMELGLTQLNAAADLAPLVEAVLAENPQQVADYKAGKEALLGFFVGRVMAASGGRANPSAVKQLLVEQLS